MIKDVFPKCVLFILIFFLFHLCSIGSLTGVSAQLIPAPPPPSNLPQARNDDSAGGKGAISHKSPTIQILNNDLQEGKNVLRINIEPASGIKECKITYLHQQKSKEADCVIDHGSIYKALIDADFPSQSIRIYVKDIYGDISFYFKELKVIKQPSLLDDMWNFIFHLH